MRGSDMAVCPLRRNGFGLVALICCALGTAASPTFGKCTIGRIAELPVTMNGLRPMVTAKINGADAQFIADSGAFFSFIAPASAAEFKLRTEPAPFRLMIQGVGGRTEAQVTTVKEFTLAGVPLRNVQFVVAGSQPGGGAVGLLGQNVLRIADVEYDLSNGAIRLMKPDGCGKTVMAYWVKDAEVYSVIDIAWATAGSPHTTSTAYLNGVKVRVLFDTGASTSVLNLRTAERAGVRTDAPGVVKAGYSRGIGSRAVETWIAPFESFKIGDEEVKHTKLRIGAIGTNEVDMLIGADFFLSHRIYVASSQRKLYFTYNGGPVFNLTSAPPPMTASSGGAAANDSPPSASGSTTEAPPTTTTAAAPTTVASTTTPASAADTDTGTGSVPDPGDSTPPPAAGPPPPIPAGEPTDAAGFARRGSAFAARRDFSHAIADLTRACELAPTEATYFYMRGRARLASRQPVLALEDFHKTLQLKPDHVQALMSVAGMRLSQGRSDPAGVAAVIADLDKVSATVAKEADIRLDLGNLYARAEAYEPALAQFDLWLEKHRGDVRVADASGSRCRAKGMLAQDLDKALADCNRAVKARAGVPFFLDSRALVYLRLANYDKAIADYDAVLALQPKNPWALHCRGLAKLHKGLTTEGQVDIAAAKAISPRAADQAARRGLTP
jgi:tetratricopeptide (TPR) repeat protein/predicted aspartyl protease